MTVQVLVSEPRELYKLTGVAATFESEEFPQAELFLTFGIQIDVDNAVTLNYSAQVQVSNDGLSWGNLGSAVSIAADGMYPINITSFGFRKWKIVFTRTGGSADFRVLAQAKSM
jgi:hypothetical protein